MAMRRVRRVLPLAVIAAAVGVGIWYWLTHRTEQAAASLVLFGNVDIREVDVAFKDAERVAAMFATEGDQVKQGQLLAMLDTSRLEPAVAQAEAQAQAQAQVVARLEAGNRPEEVSKGRADVAAAEAQVQAQAQVVARLEAGNRPEEINKARADVAAAEAEAHNAQANYERMASLAGAGVVTAQALDNATAARDSAQAALKAAQEALDLLLAGSRKEDIAAAKATLDANKAALDLARRHLIDAGLYAPADGIIRNRILEPGDMASPQRPAYTLALSDPVWVRAYVSEPNLGKIWSGMTAQVTTDSYPDKRYVGWVGYISPTAEFTPKAVETQQVRTSLVYQVRVYVHNPAGELRLGMPATVTIPLDQARPAGTADGDAQ